MNHADTMRQWAKRFVAPEARWVIERVYWDTHLTIYQHLNEGPMHALVRYYLPLTSRAPRW